MNERALFLTLMVAAVMTLWAVGAEAKPPGPQVFCDTYPNAPVCAGGVPDCSTCHDTAGPPTRNLFGADVELELVPGAPRPLSDQDFADALPAALLAVESLDSDADGFSNLEEIEQGTLPGDAGSFPSSSSECAGAPNPDYDVCNYDPVYVYRKLMVDFCGSQPTYQEFADFKSLSKDAQVLKLDDVLDECLDTEFWIGEDGVVWSLAHRKVRPLFSLRGAIDPDERGSIPIFGDYEDDYSLFVYTQIDGHDARDVLLADYHVLRTSENPTVYTAVANRNDGLGLVELFLVGQTTQADRRQGMITTRWFQSLNTMVTPVPRTTAAQTYRAYLGLDIAKMEGLQPVSGEPVDYDYKGVDRAVCAQCHSTLDPLTYPFKNYDGGGYDANRMQDFEATFPGISTMPESGVIFGQPVADLSEWCTVAANSNEFARATVMDYWKVLFGAEPTEDQIEEFTTLWQDFESTHGYSVEDMLHDLIKTEAYGAP